MKNLLVVVYLLVVVLHGYAQQGREAKTQLYQNFELTKYAKSLPEKKETFIRSYTFGKQGIADSSFPFIDRFTNIGTKPLKTNWIDSNVQKTDRAVIFDSRNALGSVYPGVSGAADVLTSQKISLTQMNNLYVELTYSTGSTWASDDSLVLQFQTSAGTWQTFLRSGNAAVTQKTIGTLIDPSVFDPFNVQLRVINYTTYSSSNTEDFILHALVFTRKWDLPTYENVNGFSKDSFPSKVYWTQAQTNMYPGTLYGIDWGNVAVFDALDENKNVYNNANGQTGFADTLTSHYIDLTSFALTDSVYMRFYYRTLPNSSSSDSLIVEFKNNVGVWLRVESFGGTPFTNFKTFIQQVNLGKFRSSSFQFRIINKCQYTANDTNKWATTGFHIGKKLLLPFIDDFSTTTVYPNASLWKDKLVYVNNQFPVHQPSINVATFDGLDSRGNAYGYGHGYCDSLTSWPINLSTIPTSDTGVYLSFYIEPTGLGDNPNAGDSLILEMRNAAYSPTSFGNAWSTVAVFHRTDSFSFVAIRVDSAYLHDDFQFRFKNIGSRTGNIHHWHLDYIRLDQGRNDTNLVAYDDRAITFSPQGVLKTYSSMPWSHFDASLYQNDTQYWGAINHGKAAAPVTWTRQIFNQQPVQLNSASNQNPNVQPGEEVTFNDGAHVNLIPFFIGDTVSFTTVVKVKVGVSADNILSNDSAVVQTNFSNYYAYDDGGAEAGYAVQNKPGSVALGYTLAQPDSIYGIAVFFNQSSTDVSGQPFNFMLWKEVGIIPPGQTLPTGETVIQRFYPYSTPVYQNQINGFYYYKFPQPYALDGKFYIGWEQTQAFELNVGLDQNFQINRQYAPNPELYYKTTDFPYWAQTQINGALMMRPIIGKWIDPPVGIDDPQLAKEELLVYPNPAAGFIEIRSTQRGNLQVELFDLTGKLLLTERVEQQQQLPLPQAMNGLYLLRIRNMETGATTTKKLIINQQ